MQRIERMVPDSRRGKELLEAIRPFSTESRSRSWWSVLSTLGVLAALLALAAVSPWWPVRLIGSLFGGLVLVRLFILYHDYMHQAILRGSHVAKALFHLVGLLLLTPPRYWRHSHNFHHANVGKPVRPPLQELPLVTSDIGSFPLMDTDTWRKATKVQRLRYRISRHVLTLLCAYVTVFFFSLSLLPFLKHPRKYADGALAILLHGSLVATLWWFSGFWMAFFCVLIPVTVAAAAGAYLFFAQHNYEGMQILQPDEWTYYRGATESSSFMKLDPVLHWLTGNIGYHHVHHLSPIIPFYRLSETMAAIPELQKPKTTSLDLHDVITCLRLNLWDREKKRLVTYAQARPSNADPLGPLSVPDGCPNGKEKRSSLP